MKKFVVMMFIGLMVLILQSACGPVKVEQFEEIGEHQTAFVVPLEGESKAGQVKFMSIEFLNQAKVATKRISIPLRKHEIGRMSWEYTWIPTVKVIKVDRTPVTREWTSDDTTGTSKKNEALWVESLDSIGFGVGVNITALIREEDAATFLYYYAGRPLTVVVDENVRGKVNSILSREFAKYNLEEARKKKNEIFAVIAEETIKDFKQYGVTITNLGLAEGMVYDNPEIQKTIDAVFQAEMKIQSEAMLATAQAKTNERELSIAVTERQKAEEFAKAAEARKRMAEVQVSITMADAALEWAKKWDGVLPANILPENSNMIIPFNNTPAAPAK